jgi:integrase
MDGTRQREKTFRGSKAAAAAELRSLVVLGGGTSDPAEPTDEGRSVTQLLEAWTAWQEGGGTEPRTVEQNRDAARLRIVPAIGNVRLSELTVHHIDQMLANWKRDGLRTSTIRRYFAPLRTALGQAVRWGWIDTNPAAVATIPRGMASERHEPPPPDVVLALIDKARGRGDFVMAAAIWLAFGAGMRRGELCALRWSDVDLMVPTVTISGNMDRNGRIGPTKTHQMRTVRVDAGTVGMLTELHEITGSKSTVLGLDNPDILTDRFRKLCELTGYVDGDEKPIYRFHDLRHSHATELLGRGASLAGVSARLGHANPRTTLTVYTHALTDDDSNMAQTMGEIMGES